MSKTEAAFRFAAFRIERQAGAEGTFMSFRGCFDAPSAAEVAACIARTLAFDGVARPVESDTVPNPGDLLIIPLSSAQRAAMGAVWSADGVMWPPDVLAWGIAGYSAETRGKAFAIEARPVAEGDSDA